MTAVTQPIDLATAIALLSAVGLAIAAVIAWVDKRQKLLKEELLKEAAAREAELRNELIDVRVRLRRLEGERGDVLALAFEIRAASPQDSPQYTLAGRMIAILRHQDVPQAQS